MPTMPVLVVLAGGVSSRMWPLREKSLMRFGTEPLLVNQLQRYQTLGFTEAVVVANPGNQPAIAELTKQIHPMQVHTVVQAQPRGMGDGLLQIAPLLASRPNTPLYVTQVHDVVDDALHLQMLRAHQANPAVSYLAGYEIEDYFPGAYLVVDSAGRIQGLVEKPGAANRPSNLVSFVAHMHSDASRLLEAIRNEYARDLTTDDHYERAMDSLIKQGVPFQVVPYKGVWKALKYPWHVLDIMDYYLAQIQDQIVSDTAIVAANATLVGNVYIGAGVRVFPGACVVGPAYIGSGTMIGNNALIRHSMVLNNCEVGYTTEIARSYVADGCAMHACRVLDSVLAPGVNFSAGCTTANLRIDRGEVPSTIKGHRLGSGRTKLGAIIGEDAFLAVDVMTMPGVKIGEKAQIGPGTHVITDVKDGQRVYVKQELVVID